MKFTDRIYIAGHQGLVGSALMRALHAQGYINIITRTVADLDLRNQAAVEQFFSEHKPEYVFLAAAKVGGIHANNTYPAEFIYDNLMIAANVIHASYRHDVKKLLFLGSSCIYPRNCPQPIKEEYLLSGELEPTNEPYALAKIAGLKLCQSYNRQYGTQFIAAMPTNLYGPGDNFNLETSHVIPGLIAKFHQAKVDKRDHVVVWGSGRPLREFLYVDDLAEALIFLMQFPHDFSQREKSEILNIGSNQEISILDLAHLIKKIVGFEGTIQFDCTKPDGTSRKLLDISRMQQLGWQAHTSLEDGLRRTYDSYRGVTHEADKKIYCTSDFQHNSVSSAEPTRTS